MPRFFHKCALLNPSLEVDLLGFSPTQGWGLLKSLVVSKWGLGGSPTWPAYLRGGKVLKEQLPIGALWDPGGIAILPRLGDCQPRASFFGKMFQMFGRCKLLSSESQLCCWVCTPRRPQGEY